MSPRSDTFRFILRGSERRLLALALFSLVGALCEAFLLGAVVQAISALSAGKDEIDLDLGPISAMVSVQTLLVGAVMAAVLRGLLVGAVAFLGPRLTASSRERHRRQLFESYLRADWATQSADQTGRLVQVLTSSVNDANTTLSLLTQALPAFLTLVVLVCVAMVLNPVTTACIIAVGLAIGLVLRPLSRRGHAASRADASGRNAVASHVSGVLAAGAEVAVLGSREGVVEIGRERIGRAERSFARAQGMKRLVSVSGQSAAFVIAASGLLLLTLSNTGVDFATVGTITVLLLRGAGLAQQVQSASTQYGAMVPFIDQIKTTIEHFTSRAQSFGTAAFPATFDLTVTGLDYVYPGTSDAAVSVAEVTFTQGSSTAILGPSGSGKSTLIQLLLRLREPTRGAIMLGGLPLPSISEESFTARVSYVPQAPHLVPGTILDNIRFFRPSLSPDDLVRAARRAHIHDDIMAMPQAYETVMDGHVDRLSGGQKQRLALARALATDPSILVLDEPTSALDAASEQAVIETIRELHGSTTVIMITHRPSTTAHCDHVLFLEDGQLRRSEASVAPR